MILDLIVDPDGSTPPPARNRGLGRAHPRAPRGAAGPAFEFQWPADGNSTTRARARAKTRNGIRIHNMSIGRSRARHPKTRTGRPAAAPQKKTRPMTDVELIDEKEKLLKIKIKKGELLLLLLPCLLLCASAEQQPSHPSIHPSQMPTHRLEQKPGTRASAPPPRRAPRAEDTGEMMEGNAAGRPAGSIDRSGFFVERMRGCSLARSIDRLAPGSADCRIDRWGDSGHVTAVAPYDDFGSFCRVCEV